MKKNLYLSQIIYNKDKYFWEIIKTKFNLEEFKIQSSSEVNIIQYILIIHDNGYRNHKLNLSYCRENPQFYKLKSFQIQGIHNL